MFTPPGIGYWLPDIRSMAGFSYMFNIMSIFILNRMYLWQGWERLRAVLSFRRPSQNSIPQREIT
jgi:hypothetical protein